jgi:hypothetical protein
MVAGTALFLPLLVLLIPPPGLPTLMVAATQRGSSTVLVLMGIAAASGALAFGEAGSLVGATAVARVTAMVNAAGCLSGALFAALPTWLGVEQRGTMLLLAVYGGLGLLGLAAALMLAWLFWIACMGFALNALTLWLQRGVARRMGAAL